MNDRTDRRAAETSSRAEPSSRAATPKTWRDLVSLLKIFAVLASAVSHIAIAIASISDKARPPLFWLSAATLVAIATTGTLLASSDILRGARAWLLASATALVLTGIWTFVYRDHVRFAGSMPWAHREGSALISTDVAWHVLEPSSQEPANSVAALTAQLTDNYGVGVAVLDDSKLTASTDAAFILTGAADSKYVTFTVELPARPSRPSACNPILRSCLADATAALHHSMAKTKFSLCFPSATARTALRLLVQHAAALALLQRNELTDAQSLFQRNLELLGPLPKESKSQATPLLKSAAFQLLVHTGNAEAAKAMLVAARSIDPHDRDVDTIFAYLLLQIGRAEQAERLLLGAAQSQNYGNVDHVLLAHIAGSQGRFRVALEHYLAALRSDADEEGSLFLRQATVGLLLRMSTDNEERADMMRDHLKAMFISIEEAQRTMPCQSNPRSVSCQPIASRLHAIAALAEAQALNPTGMNHELELAQSQAKTDDDRTWLAYWRSRALLAIDKNLNLGTTSDGFQALKAIVAASKSEDPLALTALANELYETANHDCSPEALQYVDTALQLAPDHGEAHRVKGLCLFAGLRDIDSAKARDVELKAAAYHFERAIGLWAVETDVFDMLASVYRALGETQRSEEVIKAGLVYDCDERPDGPSCTRLEAEAPMKRRDYESARSKIDGYFSAHADVHFLNAAALDLYRHGDLDGAQRYFTVVISSPDAALSAIARCNLGFVLLDRQMLTEAYQQFGVGVGAVSDDADCRAGLGVTLYAMRRRDEAKLQYQHAVALDSSYQNPDVMRRLNVWSPRARELAIELASQLHASRTASKR